MQYAMDSGLHPSRRPHDIGELNFLFTTDEAMLALNQLHLNHDYYTDILTFPMPISTRTYRGHRHLMDRTQDNAKTLNIKPLDELHRVMAHGVLHLTGLQDDTADARQTMRKASPNGS